MGQLSSSCCVLFLSYSVEEEEVNCLGDPRERGTVFADGPPYSWKLNDAMMMHLYMPRGAPRKA